MPHPVDDDAPPLEDLSAFHARLESMQATPSSYLTKPWLVWVLRSSQIDADRLDNELISMLKSELSQILSPSHAGATSTSNYDLEISSMLSLLVFVMSVGRGEATPGAQLLNLRYSSQASHWGALRAVGEIRGSNGPGLDRSQKIILGLGSVVLPYLWGWLSQEVSRVEWSERMGQGGGWAGRPAVLKKSWKFMKGVEGIYKLASLLNLVVFFNRGVYRNLVERAAGARLVYRQARMSKIISFEYLNHQLVWQELSELLLLVLPLLNSNWMRKALSAAAARFLTIIPSPHPDSNVASSPSVAAVPFPCPICGLQDILVPFEALPCRHVFCYYCLRSSCEADKAYACPIDGQRVEALQRFKCRI